MAELLEKIQLETCWAITAKTLTSFVISRMKKTSTPFLGKEEGILSLLSGWDKEVEIKDKIWAEGGRKMFPFVKDTFNIQVEDAISAAKLGTVAATLVQGPECTTEIVEATPEKTAFRITKCAWWERWFKEFGVDPGLIPCPSSCQAYFREGFKAINPKLTVEMMMAMQKGDLYCEYVVEFKEE
jgi:hypothetical protein